MTVAHRDEHHLSPGNARGQRAIGPRVQTHDVSPRCAKGAGQRPSGTASAHHEDSDTHAFGGPLAV